MIPLMALPGDLQKPIEHTAFLRKSQTSRSWHGFSLLHSAHILLVVQPNERNVFDQRLLEYKLFES